MGLKGLKASVKIIEKMFDNNLSKFTTFALQFYWESS